jgi:hypothetical protein
VFERVIGLIYIRQTETRVPRKQPEQIKIVFRKKLRAD